MTAVTKTSHQGIVLCNNREQNERNLFMCHMISSFTEKPTTTNNESSYSNLTVMRHQPLSKSLRLCFLCFLGFFGLLSIPVTMSFFLAKLTPTLAKTEKGAKAKQKQPTLRCKPFLEEDDLEAAALAEDEFHNGLCLFMHFKTAPKQFLSLIFADGNVDLQVLQNTQPQFLNLNFDKNMCKNLLHNAVGLVKVTFAKSASSSPSSKKHSYNGVPSHDQMHFTWADASATHTLIVKSTATFLSPTIAAVSRRTFFGVFLRQYDIISIKLSFTQQEPGCACFRGSPTIVQPGSLEETDHYTRITFWEQCCRTAMQNHHKINAVHCLQNATELVLRVLFILCKQNYSIVRNATL